VLANADKSIDDISKKVVGTSGPNTSVIAPSETPLGKKALEKPSAISNQQGKKLAENKISTSRTAGNKSLEKLLTLFPVEHTSALDHAVVENPLAEPPITG
jgi:hypothetical protein